MMIQISKWVVLLGPPGCGKGTQAEYLAARDEFVVVIVGDILRNRRDKFVAESEKTIGEIIDAGILLPDDVVSDLVEDELERIGNASNKNVLFDGYPRTVRQAEALDRLAVKSGRVVNCVLNFVVDHETLAKRIVGRSRCAKCGKLYNDFFARPLVDGRCDACGGEEFSRRADDNEDSLRKRLSEYHEKTSSLVDFYSVPKMLRNINAALDLKSVRKLIIEALDIKEDL
jgi:adenylate kinase